MATLVSCTAVRPVAHTCLQGPSRRLLWDRTRSRRLPLGRAESTAAAVVLLPPLRQARPLDPGLPDQRRLDVRQPAPAQADDRHPAQLPRRRRGARGRRGPGRRHGHRRRRLRHGAAGHGVVAAASIGPEEPDGRRRRGPAADRSRSDLPDRLQAPARRRPDAVLRPGVLRGVHPHLVARQRHGVPRVREQGQEPRHAQAGRGPSRARQGLRQRDGPRERGRHGGCGRVGQTWRWLEQAGHAGARSCARVSGASDSA